jgi:hypothetical protein
MSANWPFADPPNVTTITLRSIVAGDRPILYVSHDEDDGCWQFLDGGESPDVRDAMVILLKEIVAHDASVVELADLPLGWCAERSDPTQPWARARKSGQPDDESSLV